jgi:phosphatidylserine/phosphatidylglycerophosphate/cardiolipin synthase-like enzyme
MKEHQKETGSTRTSNTRVVVTDDNQFDVYQEISEKVKTAKTINIEHAYFTDKKLVQEVCDAIKRGATVNVVLPEQSDEGDKLHYGNLGTLQQLKKASEEPGAGKLNAYLYKWDDKEKTGKFTHTKAMSFDGETAIVGSTNLTSRSLRGTVTGFLFNKEMSLMVDDKEFVKDLNKNLFEKDMKPEFSRKLDDQFFKDLAKEQKKIDKKTAIQPLF